MAYKDRKPVSYSGGGGYSSRSYSYDDGGRGESKHYFEIFEQLFAESGHSSEWLLADFKLGTATSSLHYISGWSYFEEGLQEEFIYNFLDAARPRYGIHDWAWTRYEDPPGNDGRTRRLVVDKCGVDVWVRFQIRAQQVRDSINERKAEERKAYFDEAAERQAALEAERVERTSEETRQFTQQAQYTAGMLQSDFHQAFETQEVYGRDEGDFIDDVVNLYQTGRGYGEDQSKAKGVKLQITLSLDLSNSMQYNRDTHGNKLYESASNAFRDLWLTLEELEKQYADDLFIGAFTFCQDTHEYDTNSWGEHVTRERLGRLAKCLSVESSWRGRMEDKQLRSRQDPDGISLGPVEGYRSPSAWKFDGTDTWYYPLFDKIREWEEKFSDPGAIRLDLVITDAVLEHPSDIARSDAIQERRNGTLHTVMLNMLPQHEWVNSDLPLRCVQYPADSKNLSGMLRLLISEFVSVYT